MGIHQDTNSQSGSSLGNVKVHSLTLSCTLESMKCNSWASFLARAFVSPCIGRKPKAKVTTKWTSNFHVWYKVSIYCGVFNLKIQELEELKLCGKEFDLESIHQMHPSSFWVSLDFEWFWTFLPWWNFFNPLMNEDQLLQTVKWSTNT